MPKSIRRRARPQATKARRRSARDPGAGAGLPRSSRGRRVRLEMLDWHRAHGANVSRTARHFGFSRPTVYRWLERFDRRRLESLEDRSDRRSDDAGRAGPLSSCAPSRRSGSDIRAGARTSSSVLLARGPPAVDLHGRPYPARLRAHRASCASHRSAHRRAAPDWSRPWAVRKPSLGIVRAPGDLVQIDTLDVRPTPGTMLKQFTARDVVSRWDTLELRPAGHRPAAAILDALAERMPFPVRAISVDNGSEFMAEFEAACAERGIRLFVLPPRSPKLHGAVERANRTHTEEFYEVTDAEPDLASLQVGPARVGDDYNTVRPHQALGYLTPAEFLASLGIDV